MDLAVVGANPRRLRVQHVHLPQADEQDRAPQVANIQRLLIAVQHQHLTVQDGPVRLRESLRSSVPDLLAQRRISSTGRIRPVEVREPAHHRE